VVALAPGSCLDARLVVSSRRFEASYAAALLVFGLLLGAASAGAYALEGGRDSRLVVSLLRSMAPTASGSALLLALALWSESRPLASVERELDGVLVRAAKLALPGYLLAAAAVLGAGFAVASVAGVRADTFASWLGAVGRGDLGAGLIASLLDAALGLLLARRFAARVRATKASLPAKLIVIVTVTVPLRVTLALLCAPFLPG